MERVLAAVVRLRRRKHEPVIEMLKEEKKLKAKKSAFGANGRIF